MFYPHVNRKKKACALYKRTGNIWTAAFLNGLLMTIMTVANTTIFFK